MCVCVHLCARLYTCVCLRICPCTCVVVHARLIIYAHHHEIPASTLLWIVSECTSVSMHALLVCVCLHSCMRAFTLTCAKCVCVRMHLRFIAGFYLNIRTRFDAATFSMQMHFGSITFRMYYIYHYERHSINTCMYIYMCM